MKLSRTGTWIVGLAVVPLLAGCNWLNARDNMNKGVRAFRETNYQAAAEYFEQAVSFDPDVPNGQLYLGLSYSQQFIPGVESAENEAFADRAIETLEGVLENQPQNATAIAALASIYQGLGDLSRAREYYLVQSEVAPDDATALYSVGSIDWWVLYKPPEGQTVEEREDLIAEGQEYLDRALEINPEHDEAMAMKNLLYRQAALLIPEDTEDPEQIAQRDELIALADEWYDRTLEVRAERAEREALGLSVE